MSHNRIGDFLLLVPEVDYLLSYIGLTVTYYTNTQYKYTRHALQDIFVERLHLYS